MLSSNPHRNSRRTATATLSVEMLECRDLLNAAPVGSIELLQSIAPIIRAETNTTSSIQILTDGAQGELTLLLDLNRDSAFDESAGSVEKIVSGMTLTEGQHQVSFTVPPGTDHGSSLMRARLTTDEGIIEKDITVSVLDGRNSVSGTALVTGSAEAKVTLTLDQVLISQSGQTLFRAPSTSLSTLTVQGDDENSAFLIDASERDTGSTVTIVADGGAGSNRLHMIGSTGEDFIVLRSHRGVVVSSAYFLDANKFSAIYVDAGDGNNNVTTLHGTLGDDRLVVTESYATMQSTDFSNTVMDGNIVFAHGGSGRDSAWMYDSSGTDNAVMTSTWFHQYNALTGSFSQAAGFADQYLIANQGGIDDTVWMYDSTEADLLYFHPEWAIIQNNSSHSQSTGYDRIEARSVSGGAYDIAYLQDGAGLDIFHSSGSYAELAEGSNSYGIGLHGFEAVVVDGSGGGMNVLTSLAPTYQLAHSGFTLGTAFEFSSRLDRATALTWIKRMAINIDPRLGSATDATELAVLLRDHIHHRIRIGSTSQAWQVGDPYQRYLEGIVTREEPMICGGMMMLYTDLVEAFGLEARYVDLLAPDHFNNHATVEVKLNGKWVAMDPTYNVSFTTGSGELLSFAEIKAGKIFQYNRNGMVSRHLLLIENYPVTVQELTHRIKYPPTA